MYAAETSITNTPLPHRRPICIVGAGPAGLTASLYLSKFGIEHLVIDKREFPRDKVCGECFDGRVGRILEDLDAGYPEEMARLGITAETRRYTLHISGEELSVKFPDHHRPKLLSKRIDFDQFLYEKAAASPYATFRTGMAISRIENKSEGVRLTGKTSEFEARLIILAGGAGSTLGLAEVSARPSMLYGRRYYRAVVPKHDEYEVELYYFQQPLRACLVICPLPDGTHNVEVGCTRSAYKACGQSLDEIMTTLLQQLPDLHRRFAAAQPIGKLKGTHLPLPRRLGRCADDRRLWAGAGVYSFNPLTGAGVGNAMVMGQLAARTARDCVRSGDFSYRATRAYERAVRGRLRTMIRFNHGVNLLLRYIYLVEWSLPVVMRLDLVRRLLGRADFVQHLFQWRPRWLGVPRK